jgi:choline dehydrogenase-like flavoprotein
VVNPSLEAHALRGLFVMDGSVFPTNLGVNPQHSIMGVVHRAADKLANQERAAQTRHAS